jgi:tetratricopeptide (TPR) repeat protein
MRCFPLVLMLAACGPKEVPPAPIIPNVAPAAPVVESPVAPVVSTEEAAWGVVEPAEPPPPTEAELRAEAEKELQEAAGLLTTRSPEDAQRSVGLLKAISQKYPDNALAFYNLGLAYQTLGENSDARKAYLRATDIHPSLGDAWLNLGAMRRNNGDDQRAMQYYRAGLRNDAENMQLRSALVSILRQLGKYDQALEEAKKALIVNAHSLEIYNNLALVYLAQAEAGIDVPTKLALAEFYLKGAKEKPGGDQHARLQCNLGRVYEMKGLLFSATNAYQVAMKMDPDLVQCALYLTAIYLDSRNYGDAIPLLERAAALEPENAAIHLNLGISYRGASRYEDARREYNRVLELEPENVEPTLNLAILVGDYLKQFEEAVTLYETYRDGGGTHAALVDGYIVATLREKKRIEKDEKRAKRNAERELARQERQRKLAAAERQKELEALQPAVTPAPEPSSPEPSSPEPSSPEPSSPEPSSPEPSSPEQPGASDSAPAQPVPEAPAVPDDKPSEEPAGENPWG